MRVTNEYHKQITSTCCEDGGVTWNSIPGPNVRTEGFSAANGMPYVRESGIPAMLYTLDNGAVPDLYD